MNMDARADDDRVALVLERIRGHSESLDGDRAEELELDWPGRAECQALVARLVVARDPEAARRAFHAVETASLGPAESVTARSVPVASWIGASIDLAEDAALPDLFDLLFLITDTPGDGELAEWRNSALDEVVASWPHFELRAPSAPVPHMIDFLEMLLICARVSKAHFERVPSFAAFIRRRVHASGASSFYITRMLRGVNRLLELHGFSQPPDEV